MPSLAVIGSQWGDEGKGKIIDYLDEKADLIVRFQGGNNAGHTIVVGDKVFKLHGLPSGVVRPGKLAVIGNGTVVNIEELLEEIKGVEENGGNIDGLRISDRAALIMNYHKSFIIKVLLKIINTCIKQINSGEEDYNVIYTVLIFNFFISPTILEIYGISLVKYKSLRQLTRILRNICFGKEFDAKDKLSYFNKIVKKLNSFINEQIKKNIFDIIDIEKNKDSINNELSTILVNKKNTHLIRGDKTILMPTFSYQHYWGNISKVLNSVKNKNN